MVSDDRNEFISVMKQLTSNYSDYFGKLLTPLVQGIRIRGPFKPQWWEGETPKLVLMDGEGLLHQADSNTSISSKIIKGIGFVDSILLVDNAKSPMQTAPTAIMKHLAASGHANKLTVCFTHFDGVTGDNLPTNDDKINHLMGSVDNALGYIVNQLGTGSDRVLRKQKDKIYFVGGIHKLLGANMRFTQFNLRELVNTLSESVVPPKPLETHPIYNLATLAIPIQDASKGFHTKWDSLLGFRQDNRVKKEHWTRIKALSRRLAELGEDEYQNLKPVSDLFTYLTTGLYSFIDDPFSWTAEHASDDLKVDAIESVRQELSSRLFDFASDKLWLNQTNGWIEAYRRRGDGSTAIRADDIRRINRKAIVYSAEATPRAFSDLISQISGIVRDSIEASGGKLISTIMTHYK